MRLKDYIFETARYNRADFNGYKGEINVSINYNNTNYFIKGLKYINRADAVKELKQFIKDNENEIEKQLEILRQSNKK